MYEHRVEKIWLENVGMTTVVFNRLMFESAKCILANIKLLRLLKVYFGWVNLSILKTKELLCVKGLFPNIFSALVISEKWVDVYLCSKLKPT